MGNLFGSGFRQLHFKAYQAFQRSRPPRPNRRRLHGFIHLRPPDRQAAERQSRRVAQSELDRAIVEWRKVFRGDARVVDDTALTADDAANANLVFWGDPGSNSALAKLLPKLPIQWTKDKLTMGSHSTSATDHAPIFIFPNPSARPTTSSSTPASPSRRRNDQQLPPDAQAPRLGAHRPQHPTQHQMARQSRSRRLLRRTLAVEKRVVLSSPCQY